MGNLVADQQHCILIPLPTLTLLEACRQLKSAFEQSCFLQFKPFQMSMQRHLTKHPMENPDQVQLPAVLSSAESLVPKFIANAGCNFWFCWHTSFTQDHLIAQLITEDNVQQQQQWAMLDDNMVAKQSWMRQHLQHNDWLLVDDFEDDEDALPLNGKSDDKYSDSLLHEISEEQ
ncbi:hypothetical protein GGI24_002538 [Coemansia furcata]|nr:hypothetical protein GGI24_002538 [Coemansia furcata]